MVSSVLVRRKTSRLLWLLSCIWLIQFVQLGHPKSLLQVLQRSLCLRILLVQQIVEDIFVALDQSLRVLLTMLELLVTITLDSFEQSCQGQLLLMPNLGFSFLDHGLHLFKSVEKRHGGQQMVGKSGLSEKSVRFEGLLRLLSFEI